MKQKIFGIGLNKTGTTTLKLAFEKLGYKHLDRWPRLFKHWKKREFAQIFDEIESYESFEDWPWPLMVPELLDHYGENARFILTRRATPEKWVESLKSHATRTNPTVNPRSAIFGYNYPHGAEAHHIAYYNDHLKRVRALFANRPHQFIELCWEQGDSWPQLCKFLGHSVPRGAFPHGNQSSTAEVDPEFLLENQRLIREQLKNLEKV